MEAFKNQFTATELLSYKEVLYNEATEDWYVQRHLDEVECEERNCMRLAQQFCLITKEYKEWFFTSVLFHLPTWGVATHLESYLYTCTICQSWITYTMIKRSISWRWTG